MKLLLEKGCVVAEATDDYEGPMEFIPAPEDYVVGSFSLSPPEVRYRNFSALEMLDQFTEEEQIAIAQATWTNASVKLWYDRLLAAEFVNWADPRVKLGLVAMSENGFITPERLAVIEMALQEIVTD